MSEHLGEYEPGLDGFPYEASASADHGRTLIEVLLSEFTQRQRAGEAPAVEDYARAHPTIAGEIRELFPLVAAMERLKVRKEGAILKQRLTQDLQIEKIGNYRIVRELGRGGMGVVFEAMHELSNRRVAVKLLPWRHLNAARFRERFEHEAQLTAKLQHGNIVPVLEYGEQDGYSFYVMQFIEGVGLDWIIKQLRGADGVVYAQEISKLHARRETNRSQATVDGNATAAAPTAQPAAGAVADEFEPPSNDPPSSMQHRSLRRNDWQRFARIGLQVADALRYAHRAGTVHRDIKPANLLLDKDGRVWVTDFGLAEALEQDSKSIDVDVSGTLRYMAPEQFAGKFDQRSDVYALGITLYELLTLRPAFNEPNDRLLVQLIIDVGPVPPRRQNSAIPKDLETVVLKAIARDPAERFQTAGELASELRRFVNGQPIHTKRLGLLTRLLRWYHGQVAKQASSG